MTNLLLLRSSLLCGGIHFVTMRYCFVPRLYQISLSVGILTSIANHAITNSYVKWGDRVVMAIGFVVDMSYLIKKTTYFPYNIFLGCLEVSSAMGYALAKATKSDVLHQIAHLMLTIAHVNILCLFFSIKSSICLIK